MLGLLVSRWLARLFCGGFPGGSALNAHQHDRLRPVGVFFHFEQIDGGKQVAELFEPVRPVVKRTGVGDA